MNERARSHVHNWVPSSQMPSSASKPGSLGRDATPRAGGLQQSSFSETPLGGATATPVNWANS